VVTPGGYAFLGLTAIVAALVAVLTFAVLRIGAAARSVQRQTRGGAETALLTAALQDAVGKLKAQERATAARAQASERLSEEIIASLTSGLLVVGLGGEIRVVNPAARKLLSLPADGSPDADAVQLRQLPIWPVIEQCLGTGAVVRRETIAVERPDGKASPLGVTVSPLFDEQGSLHGAISLFSDLTAVRELEEQLRLKQSLATVGELTAGIAHEFRNGLATIHGYSRLFDLSALPDAYRPYVEGIRAETESLGEIVTNFLNFARPAQLTLSTVDLRAVCERAADELRGDVAALGGGIALRGDFGAIEGDEVLLRQAFSNLIRNAVEACGGAGAAPVIVIEGAVDRSSGAARIVVDDNGPGVDRDARERVFRPFFTSKRSGTGLGLALVQKIIVFHNGRITVGDSPLGGASFQIALPMR
jgi:two-component system sensor histidine kinase HydH